MTNLLHIGPRKHFISYRLYDTTQHGPLRPVKFPGIFQYLCGFPVKFGTF